jgi:hypothetical protein
MWPCGAQCAARPLLLLEGGPAAIRKDPGWHFVCPAAPVRPTAFVTAKREKEALAGNYLIDQLIWPDMLPISDERG